ncbi:hypothetical protein SteCoe_31669 [Stentor coeruleus]|uniref:Uncharacterized protein n=1 Tax=Stentor coeruleus TaxID=5963 RepID=A0A1R2B176_9CILI|nr:hypothetical protein SteCoe_31669 [Stentor coeruleus]
MNPQDYRRHCRSSTINCYEDFQIYTDDHKKIQENLDLSTKETPMQETPIHEAYQYQIKNQMDFIPLANTSINFGIQKNVMMQAYLHEMVEILESIQNRLKLEQNCKEEKNKCLRNQVLEAFFKVSSSPLANGKKKNRKSNNSIGKGTKKTAKILSGRAKGKISEPKIKKLSGLSPKLKNPHCTSMNFPKLSSRSVRVPSSNSEFKPSFLV